MGATLVLVKDEQFQRIQVPDVGYFDESIFLSDNSALTYPISNGQHDYIVDLGQFMRVSRFFLSNESAAGTLQLMSSDTLEPLDSGKWVPLTQPVAFQKGAIPSATFPEVETRYILVRFNIEDAGLIGNFGATGPIDITQADFQVGKGEETDETIKAQSPIIDYDFASAYTGTRFAFVSGGNLDNIFNMADEDPTSAYTFPAGEECVMVIDLRKETQMRTVAAQYTTQQAGLIQIYMVDFLPSHFYAPEQTNDATLTDANGHVQRAELAATGNNAFDFQLAAQSAQEIVRVPQEFFQEIEDSYSMQISANETRSVQIMDELERRFVIFRFVPDSVKQDTHVQQAVYVPGSTQLSIQQAQASPSAISFGQVEVIGDVPFDEIIFTMETEQGEPGGPPEDPPDDPPVISE